jgi:hypothetical protein
LEIYKNLTIQGPGAGLLAIDGDNARVFKVDARANVTISGLTIDHGVAVASWTPLSTVGTPDDYDGLGGGILNLGTLTLSGCNVTDNSTGSSLGIGAYGFEGGGIYSNGTLTLSGCNVTGNVANAHGSVPGYGGGIYNDGTLTLSGCNVTGNFAYSTDGSPPTKGGGIFNDEQGNLTILSSVVINNTASDGADICDLGTMTVKRSTIGKVAHK